MTFAWTRFSLIICLPVVIGLSGCQSWRDSISEYSGECYDSTCHFFNEVAIDFKLKEKAKYVRQPYEDEIKVNGDLVEFTYSPRLGRLTTLRRVEGENMLSTLDPREEKTLLEKQKTPVYGGGTLLYDVSRDAAFSGQRYGVSGGSFRLSGEEADADLNVDKAKPEIKYVYRTTAKMVQEISVRLVFKKPQCIVFEDSTGRLDDERIIHARPNVCYYAPPKGEESGILRISSPWIVILYKEDMIIMSRKSCFQPGNIAYQFQFKDGNLVFDSIIPEAFNRSGKPFVEQWQIFFRPALYSPRGLTDFLLSNHINKLK